MHGVYQLNFCEKNRVNRNPIRRNLSNCRIASGQASGSVAPLLQPYSYLGSVSQFVDAEAGNFGFKGLSRNF